MTSKTCSIIVPIYNAAPFLAQCLSSIKMQTYQDLQVILVDDGSTDESAEIAQSFVNADTRFVLYQQTNQGQGAARNVGLSKATGEFLVFVDADDYLDNDFIEKHIEVIGSLDYIQSGYRRVTVGGEVIEQKLPFHRYQFTSPCMRLYQTTYIKEHSLSFPSGMIYEDVIFSLQLWNLRPHMQCIPLMGYNYIINPHSTTASIHSDAQRTLFHTILALPIQKWLKYYTLIRLFFHFKRTL